MNEKLEIMVHKGDDLLNMRSKIISHVAEDCHSVDIYIYIIKNVGSEK